MSATSRSATLVALALSLPLAACRDDEGASAPSTEVEAPTGHTGHVPSEEEPSPCATEELDRSRSVGWITLNGGEQMVGSPLRHAVYFDVTLFEDPGESTTVYSSEVLEPASGTDDCELVQFPFPEFDYGDLLDGGDIGLRLDEREVVASWHDDHEVYGEGYPPLIWGEDVALSRDLVYGANFGIVTGPAAHDLDLPAVLTFPDQAFELTSPTFREQLPTRDVRFLWTPDDGPSELTLTLHNTDEETGHPRMVHCVLEDDGDWTPPEWIWEHLGDPILILGNLRRSQECDVVVDDEGRFITLRTFQDVELSFYPYVDEP
jgi:hypothetical protein